MAQATTDIGNLFKRKRDEKAPGAADAVEALPTCEWIIDAKDLSIGIDLSAPLAVKVCHPIQSFSSCSSEINYDLLDLDDEDGVCLLGKGKTLTLVDNESQVVITHGDIAPTTTDLSTIPSGRMLVRLKHVVAAIESVALAERTRWHAKGGQVDTSHTVCEMSDPIDDENGTTVHIYWGP